MGAAFHMLFLSFHLQWILPEAGLWLLTVTHSLHLPVVSVSVIIVVIVVSPPPPPPLSVSTKQQVSLQYFHNALFWLVYHMYSLTLLLP